MGRSIKCYGMLFRGTFVIYPPVVKEHTYKDQGFFRGGGGGWSIPPELADLNDRPPTYILISKAMHNS